MMARAVMDYLLLSSANILSTLIFLFVLLWISKTIQQKLRNKRAPPEAGGAWPIIGHLHLLGGPQLPHKVLGDMAGKYGPIFTIRMGVHQTLVVNNWEMAKECLTVNDRAFANRPQYLAADLLAYDGAMFGFSPYGSYWRQARKIATLELLSSHRLEMLKNVRESEMRTSTKEMYKLWEKNKNNSNKALIEMKRWFGDITLNVIFKMIVGKSVGYATSDDGAESAGWIKALSDFFHLSGRFVVSDALPFLRWLDIGGFEKAMKKTAEELDLVVEEWLNEHKQKRANDSSVVKGEDFMDLMLNILDDPDAIPEGRDSDTMNKATCLALILAASDTTTVTLAWALSLLVNHPDILKKTQLELDNNIGRERNVQESDTRNLVYLQAVIKETQRLYPAAPLALPHESIEDCTVGGYHIPKGTRLLLNLWKIQQDSTVWSNPFEFQPERFLTTHKDVDVKGQNFELMPFSSGRRMCPGVSFALQVMQLTLATLLHGFDFATPSGEQVDMTGSIGLTTPRATPLEVLINPRLPSHLYC